MTPDGRRVVFAAPLSGGTGAYAFLVWDTLSSACIYSNASVSGVVSPPEVAISPDGSRIAFTSGPRLNVVELATGRSLVDTNAVSQSSGPRFNADGRLLVCSMTVRNPVLGNIAQVFLYDLQTGTNRLVSHPPNFTTGGNNASDLPDISADGRLIAYRSLATHLTPGATNGLPALYLYDVQAGQNLLLTAHLNSQFSPDNRSLKPIFSGDGGTLFFSSWASDLVANDFNHQSDVFAYSIFSALLLSGQNPGQGTVLTWPCLGGVNYRAQFKDGLNAAEWRDLALPINTQGNRAFLRDPATNAAARFYRIQAF